MVYLGRPYHFKFSKGCLPQILLGPFLNTLTQLSQILYFAPRFYQSLSNKLYLENKEPSFDKLDLEFLAS